MLALSGYGVKSTNINGHRMSFDILKKYIGILPHGFGVDGIWKVVSCHSCCIDVGQTHPYKYGVVYMVVTLV